MTVDDLFAIEIHKKTVGIDKITGQAKPGAAFLPGAHGPVVVLHLTNGFDPNPKKVRWAFNFLGHVKVDINPKATMTPHMFGFVQYLRHNSMALYYAGRKKEEGSVSIEIAQPEIIHDYYLDCYPHTIRPFIVSPNNYSPFYAEGQTKLVAPTFSGPIYITGEQNANMGDHPVWPFQQQIQNVTTKKENYIYHVIDEREACSIFSVLTPYGSFIHLAHVSWKLRYEFKFRWHRGVPQPQVAENKSHFKVGNVVPGAPVEDWLINSAVSELSSTQSPISNEHWNPIIHTAQTTHNPYRTDEKEWMPTVTSDFYL